MILMANGKNKGIIELYGCKELELPLLNWFEMGYFKNDDLKPTFPLIVPDLHWSHLSNLYECPQIFQPDFKHFNDIYVFMVSANGKTGGITAYHSRNPWRNVFYWIGKINDQVMQRSQRQEIEIEMQEAFQPLSPTRLFDAGMYYAAYYSQNHHGLFAWINEDFDSHFRSMVHITLSSLIYSAIC